MSLSFNFSPSSRMLLAHFSYIWPPNQIMPASSVLENLLPADGRYCLSNVILSFTSVPPLWDQEHQKKQEPKSETHPQDAQVSKRYCVVWLKLALILMYLVNTEFLDVCFSIIILSLLKHFLKKRYLTEVMLSALAVQK